MNLWLRGLLKDYYKLAPEQVTWVTGEQATFFKRMGILPITHVMVVSERFAAKHPWVAERLIKGFRTSQRMFDEYYAEPKHLSFPDAMFAVETMPRSYGTNLWTHGVAANRKNLELFLRYAHEQGYIATRLAVEDLFAANTLQL